MLVSIIIPTFNPSKARLQQTLDGLKNQTLEHSLWELIIIDNASTNNILNEIDLTWHPNTKTVKEQKPGLTYARLSGFTNSTAEYLVMVDDDNILDKNYLNNIVEIFKANNTIGAIGGKSIPMFEYKPPIWINEFYGNLALRNLGDETIIEKWENLYPTASPIGAGMGLRKQALQTYINKIQNGNSTITDRKGTSLSSGGDNDIVLEVLKQGWQVGYFPSLSLQHIIPKERTEHRYLARLVKDTNKSWVQLLENHHINPWNKIEKWSVPLRKLKAWFNYKAWKNEINYIKWKGACGTFEGLSELNNGR